MFRKSVVALILFFLFKQLIAGDNPGRIFFIEPEWMIGKNIPIYDAFPSTVLRQSLLINMGFIQTDTIRNWVSYYNYPTIGLSVVYSDIGNRKVLGNELALIPYIIFKSSRNPKKSIDFKLGMGVTYDVKPYNKERNPSNLVVASNFNWGFHFLVYKNLLVSRKINIKSGFGLQHTSNAHTVLPNYGLNSLVLSLAIQLPQGKFDPQFAAKGNKLSVDRTKHFLLQARYGYGWHKLGGTTGPIGGPTYKVNTYSISGGVILKQQLKLRTGLTYRFYESYYHYIMNTPDSQFRTDPARYRQHPGLEASNINLLIGCEFLIGHLGLDMEGGFNVYKPFYKEFNDKFKFKNGFSYWKSKYLTTRLGLNYYLIDTSRKPLHNVFVGTHVNTNYAEADFMDVSLAYVYQITNHKSKIKNQE